MGFESGPEVWTWILLLNLLSDQLTFQFKSCKGVKDRDPLQGLPMKLAVVRKRLLKYLMKIWSRWLLMRTKNVHPLLKIQAMVALDQRRPEDQQVRDHGTWDGRWPLPSRSEWEMMEAMSLQWPTGDHQIFAVQAARKEHKWRTMSAKEKTAFAEATIKGWEVWTSNDAVAVLSKEASERVVASLRARGELHRLLQPRWVYTDKNDGLRTQSKDLPILASARLVVPGFKDLGSYTVRKDAPTASRTSQHMLFIFTACNFKKGWRRRSADIKAAFMKGEVFAVGERELYIVQIKGVEGEPQLPLPPGCIARLRKGIFGLSDSPRRWYLRLVKSLIGLGWVRSTLDYALFFLWGDDGTLEGVICTHVDDLLWRWISKSYGTS